MAGFASEVSIPQGAEFFNRFGRFGGNMAKLQKLLGDDDFMETWVKQLDESRQATLNLIPVDSWPAEWQRFYAAVFGLTVDFTAVEIPPEQPGFGWVVMVAQGLTLNQAWSKGKERFTSRSYLGDDLDKAVTINDRTPTVAYAKRLRNRVEADEENKNLSANNLAKRDSGNITLLERILLELWYHWRTGEHLDRESVTLCAGSRFSGGRVPGADWRGGEFRVDYYLPGFASGPLRSRSAV